VADVGQGTRHDTDATPPAGDGGAWLAPRRGGGTGRNADATPPAGGSKLGDKGHPGGSKKGATKVEPFYKFLDKGHPDGYRSEEIQRLVQAIRARENRLVLGLPGMGVSNLLRFLVARDHDFGCDVIFVYLNCDTQPDMDAETCFDLLAAELQKQGVDDQASGGARGYERLQQQVMGIDGDPSRRVVLVLDQADALFAAVDGTFYRRLKALTDLNKRVCLVFAASPRIAAMVDPEGLLFAGRIVPVGRLNERDCSGAITEEAQRLGIVFEPAVEAQLARLSGGYPGLLRALSSAAAAGALDGPGPEAAVVERLLARGDITHRCRKLWDALDPAAQPALGLLAAGRQDSIGAAPLVWLRDFGLVEDHEGQVRFFSPLFERFAADQVASMAPPEPLPEAHAASRDTVRIENPTFNEQGIIMAGTVYKGSKRVDMKLLELRLIACLKRERKIYTKQAIADYVYAEYQGVVSDGAIETLVSQTRSILGKESIKTYYRQGYELVV
jgi:hypothetical protein